MKTWLIILILVSQSVVGYASTWPSVQWMSASEDIYSLRRDSVLYRWTDSGWQAEDTLSFIGVDTAGFVGVKRLQYVHGGRKLTFVGDGTQQVYELDTAGREFIRLDATFHRGYNFKAIRWFRNDTLFSMGGYGFWHTHAIYSYFNYESKEWHILQTSGEHPNVTADIYQWNDEKDRLYVTWSENVHGSEVTREKSVWIFDVESASWQKAGDLNSEVVGILESGPSAILLPCGYYIGGERNLLLDLVHNRMDNIDASISDIRFRRSPLHFNGEGAFVGPGSLVHYYIPSSSTLGKSVGFRYDYQSLLNARRNPETVYREGWPWYYYGIGGVAVVLLIFLLLYIYRKMRQPFRKGATVMAEEAFFRSLDKMEVTLLRALLRAEMRGTGIKSGPITEIMGWQDKTWDNQRKWRNNLIKELNRRAADHLNIEELIVRERDTQDKRERIYRLDGDGFRLLRDSIHFS